MTAGMEIDCGFHKSLFCIVSERRPRLTISEAASSGESALSRIPDAQGDGSRRVAERARAAPKDRAEESDWVVGVALPLEVGPLEGRTARDPAAWTEATVTALALVSPLRQWTAAGGPRRLSSAVDQRTGRS
jgi:hypothetical protein